MNFFTCNGCPFPERSKRKTGSRQARSSQLLKHTLMRMHLAILIILTTCLNVFSRATAQVSLNFKQEKLEVVLKSISQQSGYYINYTASVMKRAKPVTIHLQNKSLEEALNACFHDQPITYTIVQKNILLRAKPAAPMPSLPAQDTIIRGRITDSEGKPLGGATVKLKGSDLGTITDDDGRFAIGVPDENAVLLISSVGYITIQQRVGKKRSLELSLIESTAQLQEVTVSPVNTGYENINPERFIGSATVLDSTILQRGTSSTLLSRLDGTANGLLFNKSSSGVIQMQLRGVSTLSGNTLLNGQPAINPLIIVDDFPYAGDLDNINPNDIESVTLLKDAVAASIWGARAGNGVVVITTKKAKKGRPAAITFSSNVQVQSKPDLRYFPTMSSKDFIEVEQFLFDKGFHDSYLQFPNFYTNSPAVEIMDRQRRGLLSEAEAEQQLDALKRLDVRDDFDKYVFRNGINTQNYLGISGAAGYLSYNLSIGADNTATGIKGPGGNDRYTINSMFTITPVRRLEITAGINYVNNTRKDDGITAKIVPGGRRTALYPYAQLADENGNHLAIPYQYTLSYIDTLATGKLLDWHYRPLDELNFANSVSKSQMVRLNFGAKVKLLDWLNADVKYQFSKEGGSFRNLHDERTFYARNLINSFTEPNTFKRNIPLGGILDQTFRDLQTHNLRGQLNVAKSWEGEHELNALVAAEMTTSTLTNNSSSLYGYDDDILAYSTTTDYSTQFPQFFFGSARIPSNLTLLNRTDRFVSLLGNASYTFLGRYNVYASARRDGSNLLGVKTNNRWKPLWSAGGRWNIAEEPFYKLNWLPRLSLRASYGYSGNVNNTITALATIGYAGTLNNYKQATAAINSPPNPDLRWEEVRTINFGLDFGLFKNRISGSIEYYRKKSNDVITNLPSDPTIGMSSVTKNAANLKGNGFDFQLNTQNIEGKFSWTSLFNLSYAKTVVSEYFQEIIATPLTPAIKKGEILGGMYAYRWAGLDPVTGDPRGYLGKEISKDYPAIFFDSASNQIFKGSSFPLYFGNMMNVFRYQNFEFSFNISFRSDYYFRKPSIRYERLYVGWEGHADYNNRWQKPGDEVTTNVPSMNYPMDANRDQFFENSEVNLEKGDNIRLQDLRFSYNWMSKPGKRFPLKNFQVYLFADNLNVLLWKATDAGYDPDYPVSQYPPLRSIALGIKVSL